MPKPIQTQAHFNGTLRRWKESPENFGGYKTLSGLLGALTDAMAYAVPRIEVSPEDSQTLRDIALQVAREYRDRDREEQR